MKVSKNTMKLYTITDRKDFMNKLLNSECFDSFLLQEASIHVAQTYIIDGHINTDFYSKEEQQDTVCCPYEFAEWKNIRPLCFQLIKGKRTPLTFHFVLLLKPESQTALLSKASLAEYDTNVSHFIMNIKFDQSGLSITSGVSYHSFSLNKDGEILWDKSLATFLAGKQIAFD